MLNVTLQVDEDGRRINQLKSQIEDLRRRQHDKVIFGASGSINISTVILLCFLTSSVATIW